MPVILFHPRVFELSRRGQGPAARATLKHHLGSNPLRLKGLCCAKVLRACCWDCVCGVFHSFPGRHTRWNFKLCAAGSVLGQAAICSLSRLLCSTYHSFYLGIRVGFYFCAAGCVLGQEAICSLSGLCCVEPTTLFIWAYVLAFNFVLQGVCWARQLFAHYQDCVVWNLPLFLTGHTRWLLILCCRVCAGPGSYLLYHIKTVLCGTYHSFELGIRVKFKFCAAGSVLCRAPVLILRPFF